MHLEIYAIGKLKASPELSLIKDYQVRISGLIKPLGFRSYALKEYEGKKGLTGNALKENETALLVSDLDGALIALDERGHNITSPEFANLLEKYKNLNTPTCRFIIGGAEGLDKNMSRKPDFVLSFGKLTWPHMMVRMMLVEQIYRSLTILSGHPYHKV